MKIIGVIRKFNTGRMYAANGQEIEYAVVEDGSKRYVTFVDLARGITGTVPMFFGNSDLVTNGWVLRAYDDFHYTRKFEVETFFADQRQLVKG